MKTRMTNDPRWRHHVRSNSKGPGAPRRCQNPSDGAAIACRALLAEDEVQPDAGDFDEIAVVEPHGAGDGSAIDVGHLVAWTEIVTIVALIDLSGHLRLEPARESNGGHGGFSDDGEFVGKNILFLVGLAVENDKGRHFHARSSKL